VYMSSGVVEALQLCPTALSSFLSAVAGRYRPEVPFHNFQHAVQTLHTVWMVRGAPGMAGVWHEYV
jgi:hypothetical protein